jgi:hypothetical protein
VASANTCASLASEVMGYAAPAKLVLQSTRIENSARAGLSAFGGSMAVGGTRIQCAAFGIVSETFDNQPSELENLGDNLCGTVLRLLRTCC